MVAANPVTMLWWGLLITLLIVLALLPWGAGLVIAGMYLLNPLFRPNRWDYVFRYQYASGKAELRRVVILFTDEKVASIKADDLPVRDDTSDPALPGYQAPGSARN